MSTPKLYEISHVSSFDLDYSGSKTTVSYKVARGLTYRVELPLEESVALHAKIIEHCETFRRRAEDDLLSAPEAALARIAAPKSEDNLGAQEVDFQDDRVPF